MTTSMADEFGLGWTGLLSRKNLQDVNQFFQENCPVCSNSPFRHSSIPTSQSIGSHFNSSQHFNANSTGAVGGGNVGGQLNFCLHDQLPSLISACLVSLEAQNTFRIFPAEDVSFTGSGSSGLSRCGGGSVDGSGGSGVGSSASSSVSAGISVGSNVGSGVNGGGGVASGVGSGSAGNGPAGNSVVSGGAGGPGGSGAGGGNVGGSSGSGPDGTGACGGLGRSDSRLLDPSAAGPPVPGGPNGAPDNPSVTHILVFPTSTSASAPAVSKVISIF
ncbi:unnamed protein product [Protopolystoma xenopodis]|uniref:Uncharacterized protein n=1 Tax=Protopolystoma xenopodis TaxID=117903 RepID=A0A3S5AD78_9PLAT|nr:unnamed protein product [Protopolystoma xenopodis]